MKKSINNNLVIEFHVPDFNLIKDFYSKLGFVASMEDEPHENKPGYLTMTREETLGKTMLNFYGGNEKVYDQAFFKQFPKETKRGYAASITICTNNIDTLYELAQSKLKDSIVREIKEVQDSGQTWKDFRMVDPFGFYLRFTELIDWGQE